MTESAKVKLERFQHALRLFVDRLDEDPNILAAVLVGSLCEETMWRRERIYLWLIEVDGVTKRLRADGDGEDIFRTLCEEGINIPVQLIPRSRFRKMVEGTSRTAFSCNFFAKRELVYCADPSIQKWFDEANTAATAPPITIAAEAGSANKAIFPSDAENIPNMISAIAETIPMTVARSI